MKLIIYYDGLMNTYSCWSFFYYVPVWCCIMIALCIRQFPSSETAVNMIMLCTIKEQAVVT